MSLKKVLIVDDSTVTRLMIKKIITEAKPDTHFIEFDTADKAKSFLESSEQIDFITLDQNMPGDLSGLDLAEQILAKLPNVKIAMITANVQDAIRDRALKLGVHFIEKPVSQDKILPLLGGL